MTKLPRAVFPQEQPPAEGPQGVITWQNSPLTATMDFVCGMNVSLFYQHFIFFPKKLLTGGFCITLILSTD